MLVRRWILILAALAAGLLLLLFLRKPGQEVSTALPQSVAVPETSNEIIDLEAPTEIESQPRSPAEPLDLQASATAAELVTAQRPGERPATMATIRGRVVGDRGEPIPHLRVRLRIEWGEGSFDVAAGDATGRFSFETDRTRGTLVAVADGVFPVMGAALAPHRLAGEHLLVSVLGRKVRGIVTDAEGSGIEAYISTQNPLVWPFSEPMDGAVRVDDTASGRTAPDGRFELDGVADVDGVVLFASREDYGLTRVEIPRGEAEVTLVLQRRELVRPLKLAITGVVLLPDRSPAAGARVAYGHLETETDEQGSFHLSFERMGGTLGTEWSRPEMILAAGLKGYAPAILPRFGEVVAAASPHAPAPATLILGSHTLSLAGVVVDEGDSPLEGWMVSVLGTEVSQHRLPILYAETLGGSLLTRTAEDGAFRIQGLLDRDYVLRAVDPRTFVTFETDPFPAGDEHVRIQIPSGLAFPRVVGIVRSSKGSPIAGARVLLGVLTQQTGWTRRFYRDELLSDEDGAFEFLEVPRRGAFLQVRGDALMPADLDLSPDLDATAIAIQVMARCDFRIQVKGGKSPFVQVLDAAGEPLSIQDFMASGSGSRTAISSRESAMQIWSVSEEATTLRILEDLKDEIHRRPITLIPGEVTEIRVEL